MNQRKAPESYLEYTETFLMASVDTAIAAQNTVIAAESEGVGCTYIGGIRNNLPKVMGFFPFPTAYTRCSVWSWGIPWRTVMRLQSRGCPFDVVLKEEKYHTDGEEEQIRAYDEVIRQYYIDRTDGKKR